MKLFQDAEVTLILTKIAEAFLRDKMDKQSSYPESLGKPKNLQLYVRRYDLGGFAVVTISAENDSSFACKRAGGEVGNIPKVDDEFFLKVVDTRIKFLKDDEGDITKATLFQNGQEITAGSVTVL